LHREDAVCGNGVAVRWRGVLHDLFAPEELYHNLSARGIVVFCLARRGLIYISSRVSGKPSIFHGYDDSRFVAHWIFVSF
jgi:hypothetical protein